MGQDMSLQCFKPSRLQNSRCRDFSIATLNYITTCKEFAAVPRQSTEHFALDAREEAETNRNWMAYVQGLYYMYIRMGRKSRFA